MNLVKQPHGISHKTNSLKNKCSFTSKSMLFALVLCSFTTYNCAQDFVTFYAPGYSLSSIKASNVVIDNAGTRADFKGPISNILMKGDGISNKFVFGMDVSQVLIALLSGFDAKHKSIYADGFSARMGYAIEVAEGTKVGLGFDLGNRGVQYFKDDIAMSGHGYNYWFMGATLIGLHSIGEKIYIMPKLSIDPMLGPALDKMTDGLSSKFEVSLGYRFGGKFGVSLTPGFEKMKFLYQNELPNNEVEIKKSFIKTKFLQFGISFMLN